MYLLMADTWDGRKRPFGTKKEVAHGWAIAMVSNMGACDEVKVLYRRGNSERTQAVYKRAEDGKVNVIAEKSQLDWLFKVGLFIEPN